MLQQMQRNPQAWARQRDVTCRVMQQLQKSMNPQMLAQMGGAKNLMSMMKNIDMNAMKKMMGQFYPVCGKGNEWEARSAARCFQIDR